MLTVKAGEEQQCGMASATLLRPGLLCVGQPAAFKTAPERGVRTNFQKGQSRTCSLGLESGCSAGGRHGLERRFGQQGTIDSVNCSVLSHVQTLLMFVDETLH